MVETRKEVIILAKMESTESRYNRDIANRGGDFNGVKLDDDGNWTGREGVVYDENSRNDREYDRRGGDEYVSDGEVALDKNGRNSREYATPDELASSVTAEQYDDADNLAGSPIE